MTATTARGTLFDLHAAALASAGWSYGFTSYVDRSGRTMIAADAHKGGVRFIVHAECRETALLELKVQALRQSAKAN